MKHKCDEPARPLYGRAIVVNSVTQVDWRFDFVSIIVEN